MSKHTSGPWIIEQRDPLACTYSLRLSKMGIDSIDGKESDANARLIAAAPELLEALILCREELNGLPHSLGYEFTHIPQIDAAIAKARGEA